MGIKDDIAAEVVGKREPCLVGRALEQLSKKDRGELQEMLDMDRFTIPHAAIARVLANRGFGNGDAQPVSRHRRGLCCRGHR